MTTPTKEQINQLTKEQLANVTFNHYQLLEDMEQHIDNLSGELYISNSHVDLLRGCLMRGIPDIMAADVKLYRESINAIEHVLESRRERLIEGQSLSKLIKQKTAVGRIERMLWFASGILGGAFLMGAWLV